MSARDIRDPWYIPAPLEGPPVAKHAALCLRPNGMKIDPAVEETALRDSAKRLEAAGWTVEEIADTPSFAEATELQIKLWLGDGFAGFAESVEREGDPGALAVLAGVRDRALAMPPGRRGADPSTRRNALTPANGSPSWSATPSSSSPSPANCPFRTGWTANPPPPSNASGAPNSSKPGCR